MKISVIGIGGRGLNALNNIALDIKDLTTIAVDTDSLALKTAKAKYVLQVGEGRSTAGSMELGRKAVENLVPKIVERIEGSELVVVISGLGGGTGSGGHSVLVENIKSQLDTLVVSFVTIPFRTEALPRINNAKTALPQIIESSDMTIVHFNDKLKEKHPTMALPRAYRTLDKLIANAIYVLKALDQITPIPGLMNVDFNVFKSIAVKSGLGFIGLGEGLNVREAFIKACESPYCELNFKDARGAIVVVESTETALSTSDIFDIQGTITSKYNVVNAYFGFKPTWAVQSPKVGFIATNVKSDMVTKFIEG
ncbi:MAG: hypothetical protein DRN04_08000 [Thermoprotei archaeon]|nr:MAG: hypothetical protein DRN04_08000 [Thermoprotei archaeon]